MFWIWLAVGCLFFVGVLGLAGVHVYILRKYLSIVVRIFQEKPLFIKPFGKPQPDAEDLRISTPDRVELRACYLKAKRPRKGVIMFGLEFGSECWSCIPYTEFLRDAGYDIFAFEPRGQGKTPTVNDYEPLQWVTEYDANDFRVALDYLKQRPDAAESVGMFGLSKGGSTGLYVGGDDPYLSCFITDGAFGTKTTLYPYMYQWVFIYANNKWVKAIPKWYFRYIGHRAIKEISHQRNVQYVEVEKAMPKLAPRPLLMIHGGGDNYIKPDMARTLFGMAGEPKELWVVDKAKHNQAFHIAAEEYRRRVVGFFDRHLARGTECLATKVG